MYRVSHRRMFIAYGRVFGLSSSRSVLMNTCPKVSHYKDMGLVRLLALSFHVPIFITFMGIATVMHEH